MLWDRDAPSRTHQGVLSELSRSLGNFIEEHGGRCRVYQAPFAVNLFNDDSTFVEPNLSAICDPSRLSGRGCEGAPDFVVEVASAGNPGMDYVTKLNLYREAGVREYWICDPARARTLVYTFAGNYVPTLYPFPMPAPSNVFPGFEADFGSMLARG